MPGRRKRKLRYRAQEFVDGTNVYTHPDCMEVLTTRYKEKCKVESSTESESDAYTTEVLNRSLLDSIKNPDTVNQYLDPYDGDLESTSSESDSPRQLLQDVYTEKMRCLSHAVVADDGRKLAIKPCKQSLLMRFPLDCNNTELNSTQMETVATGLPQFCSESEVLTNNCVADAGQKQFGSLELDVLTGSSTVHLDIERKHRFVNMFVNQDHKNYDPRCPGQLLKATHENFLEERRSSKRKLGNPLTEANCDHISKKKSCIIKAEVSNFVFKWSV